MINFLMFHIYLLGREIVWARTEQDNKDSVTGTDICTVNQQKYEDNVINKSQNNKISTKRKLRRTFKKLVS